MKRKIRGAASPAPNNVGVMSPADPPPISPVEESSAMPATTPQAEFFMRFFKIQKRHEEGGPGFGAGMLKGPNVKRSSSP